MYTSHWRKYIFLCNRGGLRTRANVFLSTEVKPFFYFYAAVSTFKMSKLNKIALLALISVSYFPGTQDFLC